LGDLGDQVISNFDMRRPGTFDVKKQLWQTMYGMERDPVENTGLPHQIRTLVVPKNRSA